MYTVFVQMTICGIHAIGYCIMDVTMIMGITINQSCEVVWSFIAM